MPRAHDIELRGGAVSFRVLTAGMGAPLVYFQRRLGDAEQATDLLAATSVRVDAGPRARAARLTPVSAEIVDCSLG